MVQNYVKNYDDKIIANIFCDVHYYPTKFEIKIQLVYGETKNKLYYGIKWTKLQV